MPAPEVLPDLAIAESLFRIAFDTREATARKLPILSQYCTLDRNYGQEYGRMFEYSYYDKPRDQQVSWQVVEQQGSLLVNKFVDFKAVSLAEPARAGDLMAAIDLMPTIRPRHKKILRGLGNYLTSWGPMTDMPPEN